MIADDADLVAQVTRPFTLEPNVGPIGLAVSGGSDSMALLWLIGQWVLAEGRSLRVATVDHGLRPEAVAEAGFVAKTCQAMTIPHDTLTWSGWSGQGNLPAAARQGRYDLLAGWAKAHGITRIALGHTLDDQAETVLMRLARGSGADGLAGMRSHRVADGITWVRPLLTERRQALRDYLTRNGHDWIDDPTNDDDIFDRVKARKALAVLAPLGITAEGLGDTAMRMGMARHALEHLAHRAVERSVTFPSGDMLVDRLGLAAEPYETQLRVLATGLCWLSGNPYRPRLIELQDAYGGLATDKKRTLHGVLMIREGAALRLTREHNAVRDLIAATTETWDGRWQLDGPHAPDLRIRALGAALSDCPDWRAAGLSRSSLIASPSVWQGDRLIAAPLAGHNAGWQARIVADYASSLIAH